MIYHWCPHSEWEAAEEFYTAPSLADEGFIHFSRRHQVERVSTALDPGRTDLVLLAVDETGLEIVDEDCYETGEEFPHLYGPLPVSAVVSTRPFPPEEDGSFRLPDGV